MAKIIRKRRKIDRFNQFAAVIFTIAILAQIGVSLFIGTYNTNLTMEIQNMANQINTLQEENEKINIAISSLENKDRVYEVATTAGLEHNQDNVIFVAKMD